jgi:hypothetical protein
MGKIVIMDITINYLLESGKEKELTVILNNSILKEFERMDNSGDFIPVHYAVLKEKDAEKDKEN